MPDPRPQLRHALAMQLRTDPFSNPAHLRRCRIDWNRVLREARAVNDQDTAAFAITVLQFLGEAHVPHGK